MCADNGTEQEITAKIYLLSCGIIKYEFYPILFFHFLLSLFHSSLFFSPPPLPSPSFPLLSPLLFSPVQPQRGNQTLQPVCQQLHYGDANLRESDQEEGKIYHVPPTKVQPEQDQPQSAGPPPQTNPEVPPVHPLLAGIVFSLCSLCEDFLQLHHLTSYEICISHYWVLIR